ncbi:MAG: RNA-binding protein [Candidatus Kapabacteria bacterium]|nr:RNA-binding protein [Ignavibacteriota bacterium]MCW5885911.1 RNA-binding protein [Candidatus Kapabacteria bacterium]
MNIYVGNLNFKTTEESLSQLFGQYGAVHSVKLISDRQTGRRKGFGFVEMDNSEGEVAIRELNDKEFDGRNIKVNEAREREESETRSYRR